MKVLLYNASWRTLGGGEKYLCVLADELARIPGHQITLVVDEEHLTLDVLRKEFHVALEGVTVAAVERKDVKRHLRTADACFILSNVTPFGHPAPVTVYALQIPYPPLTARVIVSRLFHGHMREAAKDLRRRQLMRDARRATGTLAYSRFVTHILETSHGIRAQLLYPPIDDFSISPAPARKQMILSVGRIFRGLYNDKRYDIMIEAFRQLHLRIPGLTWEYCIAGRCGDDHASQRYLAALREAAHGLPVRFAVSISHHELQEEYASASIFWHAAGFGVDEATAPERTEHFGMSTAEAMMAGSVPVVVNRGGQKEIVSHGDSGYLWDSIDELVNLTSTLITNPGMIIRMRSRAQEQAHRFDRNHFAATLHDVVDHWLRKNR